MPAHTKHIIILGGGFAGLEMAKSLTHPSARITLVDRQNHHLFQPLLYQVATAGLSMPEIAKPIRSILNPSQSNLTVLMDEVTGIDLNAQKVTLRKHTLDYDYLLIGLGAVTSYFGHDEWEAFAPGLKSLDDALRIRRDVLYAFERAEAEDDRAERRRLMTLVVVGGGPTGVELAGAFAELAQHVLRRDFTHIDPADARIILVEAAPKILGQFPDPLPEKARKQLEGLGVEVRTSSPVKDIQERKLILENETIEAENIIWAAGVQAHPLTRTLGVELDRAGRIQVSPDCSIPGHPNAFAAGDITALTDVNGKRVPGVSPAAIQMARHVSRIILAELDGKDGKRPPFAYFDKGSMATIGRSAAVSAVGPWKATGLTAWLLWLFVHLVFLVGFRNKLAVLLQWFYSYVNYKRGARIITGLPPRP